MSAWGWAGNASDYLSASSDVVLDSLAEHHRGLLGAEPSGSQVRAWQSTDSLLRAALAHANTIHTGVDEWNVVFEYELPLEGGRRPDVLIFGGQTIFVLEFKESPVLTIAHADQVEAYARDIRDYHSKSRALDVRPVLVSSAGHQQRQGFPAVRCAGTPEQLADEISGPASGPSPNLSDWLMGDYSPLPTIVDAARRIFQHERLPRIWAAESAGVHRTVELVQELAERAETKRERLLVLLAGVPGSGKTLAGLRIVYEQQEGEARNGEPCSMLRHYFEDYEWVKEPPNGYRLCGRCPASRQ